LRRSGRSEKSRRNENRVGNFFLCLFAVFSFSVKTQLRRENSPVAALKIHEPLSGLRIEPDVSGKMVKLSEVSSRQKNRNDQFLGELVPVPAALRDAKF